MQKSMVLVASRAVLKLPQKNTPAAKPPSRSVSKEYFVLGRLSAPHNADNPSFAMIFPQMGSTFDAAKDKGAYAPLSLLPVKFFD
jgi:hypothetical protein